MTERVELQRRAKPRRPGELGAFDFQRWLERWKGRSDVHVVVGAIRPDGTLGDAAYAEARSR